jgi:hypothetical protein
MVCDFSASHSVAGTQHFVQHGLEGVILEGGGDALLVAKLLVDLAVLIMGPGLHANVDAVVGRERPLEAAAHGQADDSGQGAMVDGRSEIHSDRHERVWARELGWRRDKMDVGQPHDRQLTQRVRVLWV